MANPIISTRQAKTKDGTVKQYHYYWCPGCNALHSVAILPDRNTLGAGWEFTGTLECPTYSPSQLSRWSTPKGEHVCHTFIKQGQIQFLNDCTHAMKGQTVPLPPLPDWVIQDEDD